MKWILIAIYCLCSLIASAQYKYEKESRVKIKDVPAPALEFTKKIKFDKRIKWYKEESDQGLSYELKSRIGDYKYSIEFDVNGLLLDVEREVQLEKLPTHVQQLLVGRLNDKFEKYKIKKVQVQAKGNNNDLHQFILNDSRSEQIIISYELVVKGTLSKKDDNKIYEILINPVFGITSFKEVISRPTDKLEF